MIGNDVVDLKLAVKESAILRKAVLDKIFTRDEKNLILNAACPFTMAWLCWSQKEAAYKIVNRLTSYRFYAPQAFESCLTPVTDEFLFASPEFVAWNFYEPEPGCIFLPGMVQHNKYTYYTKSLIDTEKIITVAAINPDFSTIEHKISGLYEKLNQQHIISNFLENTDLEFCKDERGLPLLKNKLMIDHAATLSHHGRYICMAWEIESKRLIQTEAD